MGTMPRLKIADLLANAPTDPEAHLHPARVERYALMLDDLPAVVVFDTPEGPLLADGHHRLAAARRLGRETVEAEVRAGSRQEALRYAAAVGGAQRGIPPEEAASRIRRRAKDGHRGFERANFGEQPCHELRRCRSELPNTRGT